MSLLYQNIFDISIRFFAFFRNNGLLSIKFFCVTLPHMSILAGVETEEGREIQKVYFLENKDHAEDHFTLDPRDQMNAIKDMRASGLKPLGN